MSRCAVNKPNIPQPPVEGVWGDEGVHADARQDVENGVDHISIEVISTVLTGIKILPSKY